MSDRTHGYDVSLGYIYNFYREMAADWIDFCAGAHGYEVARRGSDYRYLDLGCGQGFGLCLLAAANPDAEFVGVDFQAEHIAHGQALAEAADLANVRFLQADFIELAKAWPVELGAFDYVGLQGILSWISPELRAAVMQCVEHATRQGSLVYFGYNTQPGSLSAIPFQHVSQLIKEKAECSSAEALDRSIKLFQGLTDAKAPIFQVLPGLRRRVEGLASLPKSYLVHEYLSGHWIALWHSQVASEARGVGLSYVGTATVAQALLPDAIPAALRALILQQADSDFRQDLQDLVTDQSFRRDIFHRGEPGKRREARLDPDARLHLLSPPPPGNSVMLKSTFGDFTVDRAVIADIIERLSDGPAEVSSLMALRNPGRQDTRRMLLLMLQSGILMVGSRAPAPVEKAERFNAAVARSASKGVPYNHVAAAQLGSGVLVSEIDLLLIDSWLEKSEGRDAPSLIDGVYRRLTSLGRHIHHGSTPVPEADLRKQLGERVAIFLNQQLPHWRRLGALQ